MKKIVPAVESATGIDIVAAARQNDAFRRVVETGKHEQVVLMTISPGGDIGAEVHPHTDQLFIFVDGEGEAQVGGTSRSVAANDLVFVRAGTRHNFINRGNGPLRVITVYAPPQHAPGTVHQSKADAEKAEAEEH
jgi:mannose-6-phosphate isomerase-like protein (cupin superfamily)